MLQTGQAMAGNRYRTDLLQRMATALQAEAQLDTLPEGRYVGLLQYKAHPVTVVVADSVVTHIGYSLFSEQLREAMSSPAFDFVERYPLFLDLPVQRERSVARHLDEDGVFFRGGKMDALHQVAADTTLAVSVENLNGKRYTVHWMKGDEERFAINFPIDYDLLAGTDMEERERRLLPEVAQWSAEPRMAEVPDSARLKTTWQGRYFILPGEKFYLPQINSDSYYERDERDSLRLLCNTRLMKESVANLLTTGQVENDYDLEIRMVKYGFKYDTLQVRLNQWINYCLDHGCKPYFGLIDETDGVAKCELIMWNPDMGYLHSMRVVFDMLTLSERKGLVQARLNAFVEISKVQYLFDEIKL